MWDKQALYWISFFSAQTTRFSIVLVTRGVVFPGNIADGTFHNLMSFFKYMSVSCSRECLSPLVPTMMDSTPWTVSQNPSCLKLVLLCLVAVMRKLINVIENLKHSDLPIIQVPEKEAEKACDGPAVCPLPTWRVFCEQEATEDWAGSSCHHRA